MSVKAKSDSNTKHSGESSDEVDSFEAVKPRSEKAKRFREIADRKADPRNPTYVTIPSKEENETSFEEATARQSKRPCSQNKSYKS
ncbi:hypothetical protein COOONC_16031 [Cooperia oncophora]